VSIGLFKVDLINNFSYVCSFQKRLNGQGATEDDPMTRQMGVNVNLDYKYGLQLTEGALLNCRGWLGVDVQRCFVPLLQSSPLKRSQQSLGASAPRDLEKRQRVQFVQDDEDAEEADDRLMHKQRLLDSAGNSLYVNKHQGLLQGLNQSVMLRTVIPEAKRRVMFPEAFTMGPSLESAVVYQDAEYIFRQAEQRNRGNRQTVGMGDAVVCRGKCYWGRLVDKEFLRKVALFTTEDFDSNGSHKLCMEHFSPDASPSAIKECDELVRCLRGLLLTYDELWDVGWKKSLETTFVDFLENFERRKSIRLDWHYASRVVLSFFHHLQEAAQQPRVGISMVGQDTPLVRAERLASTEEWVPFMLEAFIPFCEGYFSTDMLWTWGNKKLGVPQQQFCQAVLKHRTSPGKGSGGGAGGRGSSSSSSSSAGQETGDAGRVTTPLKFCIVDAFQFVSIPRGTLDEKTVKQCGGPSCKFVHVSAGYPNTRHVHKDVFVGILSALTRMDKKVKMAWTEAMSGPQGEKVFKKPFANKA
jgi:hypothetical protein